MAPRWEKLSTTRIVPSGQSTGAAAGGTRLVGKPFWVILVRVRRSLAVSRTRWSDVALFASWRAYAAVGLPEASSAKPETPSSVRFGASATTRTSQRPPKRTTRRIHVRRASTSTAFSETPATRPSTDGSVAIAVGLQAPSRDASSNRRPSIHATRGEPSRATASAP